MKRMRKMKTYLLPIAILAVLGIIGCAAVADVDTTAPTVASTVPADSATGIGVTANITATFSEAMDSTTITGTTFTLKQGSTAVAGTVTFSDTDMMAIFNPTSNLAYDTEYIAKISTGAKDVAGNPLAVNEVWTFTTAVADDPIAPTVTVVVPFDSATDVAINTNIAAAFSEAMDAESVTTTTFKLAQGATPVQGVVTYNSTTMIATFNPVVDLLYNKGYTVTITTSATDVFGNGLDEDKVWNFATGLAPDTTAPTVASTFPADSAIDVAVNSSITATFSEAMNPATIVAANFTVNDGTSNVLGMVTYGIGNMTAVFAPNENLAADTTYTAAVSTVVTDAAGNAIVASEVWTFTTIPALGAGPAPVSLGTAGNYVILAKSEISTVPGSLITGDVGLSPAATSYITGFSLTDWTGYATSTQVTGFVYAADMAPPTPANMTTAISDMETAYTDAAGRSLDAITELGAGQIGGMTLAPGLYKWGTGLSISTNLTLDGAANDVWIFQIGEGLTVASGVQVILAGGAQAKNIFWQMAEAATLNTTSHMEGTILSLTAINLSTGASVNGRLMAQTAVTLEQNTVTEPAP